MTINPPSAIDVAVAVIVRADGSFLLAQRPAGKPYAGYWEFPGGKVEAGEAVAHALARELHEELGIELERAYPWITQNYTYPHAQVRLRFFRVLAWRGEPHGREDQRLEWQSLDSLTVSPLLPANGPVLKALSRPPVYAISNAGELGEAAFLQRARDALQGGLRLIQVREKTMPNDALAAFAARVVGLSSRYGARVLINSDAGLARQLNAQGVHLTARQLDELQERPGLAWCGASCHDAGELLRAQALGVDFAVVGPVLPTLTHPHSAGMGWRKFAELIHGCSLPVYAIGGMAPEMLQRAWEVGAHGVCMQRAAW